MQPWTALQATIVGSCQHGVAARGSMLNQHEVGGLLNTRGNDSIWAGLFKKN